jgi:predicted nucleic-acid-binding Zn-ribbon protein
MAPSEEEAKLIGDWLDRVAFKCPGCRGDDSFSLGGTIAVPNVSASEVLGEPNLTSFVTLRCKRCAYVSLLDPTVMKLPR